jgi:putative ABC transport system permease protein
MRFVEIFNLAFDAMVAHKMRSLLTMLGIIIGVGAVVTMIAIGNGANSAVQSQIASLGTNFMMVFPGATVSGGVSSGAGNATTLDMDDIKAIRERAPAVALVSPSIRTNAQVVAGNLNWSTLIQGMDVDGFGIRDWKIAKGDFFTDQDARGKTKVCVIGKTVSEKLFPDQDPLGQSIRIKNLPFTIVGVLGTKGQNSMGQDQDDVIIAPFGTVQRQIMGVDFLGIIMLSAVSVDQMAAAQQQVTDILREQHRLADWQDNDFTIRTQTEIGAAASSTTGIMTMLLGGIASVSLIVGGIGIMNIMLVSVTERTREIGIRRSLGARRRDILQQFLVEAIFLSIMGGLIGIGLGIGASRIVAAIARWPVSVSPESLVLSFLFSATVGVFFGFYPAQKAAKISPMEALRYE